MRHETIIDDHATFRTLLKAMSRPGTVERLPRPGAGDGPDSLLLSLARCLMDHEVTHCVPAAYADLGTLLARDLGSRPVREELADFLIFPDGESNGSLALAKRGSLEYPDQGATVLYLVEELREIGGTVSLNGPGIPDTARPLIRGVASEELALLREVNAEFPLGVDAIFLDNGGCLMCIPRSTRMGVN